MVAERTVRGRGRTTRAVRYYISNLPVDIGAARMANLVRGHWRGASGCENSLQLGAGRHTREDRCRLRIGHAARNMAGLRRVALNILALLQQYFWPKLSIRRLRKMVARNPARLEPLMATVTTLSTPCPMRGESRDEQPSAGHVPDIMPCFVATRWIHSTIVGILVTG